MFKFLMTFYRATQRYNVLRMLGISLQMKQRYPLSLQGFLEAVRASKGLQTFKNKVSNLAFVPIEIT